jgi:type II secretory ATPase GspE/PulE/Tfp pilus assembly ATPase PilB-like protein
MQILYTASFVVHHFLLLTTANTAISTTNWFFNPVKIILLVGWVYLCLYCVQQIEHNSAVPKGLLPAAIVTTVFLGPLVLVLVAIIDLINKQLHGGSNLIEVIKQHFQGYSTIKLTNTSGMDVSEIYTEGQTKSQNRQIISLAKSIIADALDERASDIIIEPKGQSGHTITFRIDGMLWEIEQIEAELSGPMINCLKAVSEMNIREKHDHQEGSFIAKTAAGPTSFRSSVAGFAGGEKMGIRVLSQDIKSLRLNSLGITKKQQMLLKDAIGKLSGMILICGPAGSGKTTTTYTILNEIDRYTSSIVTLEDPIEYLIPGVNQIEINPGAGISFASSLSNALRQDPDVIAIDELRDKETAVTALEAARGNKLVIATIRSDSTSSALLRLLDLGAPAVIIASGLSMIVSQRLIRQLCSKCKRPAELSKEDMIELRKKKINYNNIYQAVGCEDCRQTGYFGVTVIFDMLIIDDRLKHSIANNTLPIAQLRKEGDQKGRSNLQKQGLMKVVSGITTLEELTRVTG